MDKIIPNTTQVPNLIIDKWMPLLKDTEFRCVIMITRKTMGWIEDPKTGRRKEKDWISQGQLMRLIRRSDRAISSALHVLIDKLRIVEAYDEFGHLLDSPRKRMRCGGKIYYRLSLRAPDATLFDTPEKSSGDVQKVGKRG